ncbi:baseplate J protein [Bacillus phage vB_BceM-HSE3]|nr:baseplate J protein [Bacillus phage vB_BceM-HSE3]
MDNQHQPKISYTNRDFRSNIERLQDTVSQLTDRWTDFNESDPGVALAEVMFGLSDMLSFYMDNQALENYIGTVSQRNNLKGILKIIGYQMDGVISSSSDLQIKFDPVPEEDLVLEKFTRFQTNTTNSNSEPVYFVCLQEILIRAGTTEITVPVVEGKLITQLTQQTEISKDLTLTITDDSVATGSISLMIDNYYWESLEPLKLNTIAGRYFSVELDNEDKYMITLPINWKSYVKDHTSQLVIRYLISSGPNGNVGANKITQMVDSFKTLKGVRYNANVTITNKNAASGGTTAETMDQAKKQAPLELRTMWTAVTLNDYKALTEGFPGISKAQVLDWSVPGSPVRGPYQVRIYPVPADGGRPSEALKNNLREYLNQRKVVTVDVDVEDPTFVPIDIDVKAFTRNANAIIPIQRKIYEVIAGFFSMDKLDFGQSIRTSNLVTLIQSCHPEISYIDLDVPEEDITLGPMQFPQIGEINVKALKEVL